MLQLACPSSLSGDLSSDCSSSISLYFSTCRIKSGLAAFHLPTSNNLKDMARSCTRVAISDCVLVKWHSLRGTISVHLAHYRPSAVPHHPSYPVAPSAVDIMQGERRLSPEGGGHFTRTQSDIATRVQDLAMSFRVLEVGRWKAARPDLILQVEKYKEMLLEQSELRSPEREDIRISFSKIR